MTNKFEDFIKPFEQRSDEWTRGAATAWQHRQNEIDSFKTQLAVYKEDMQKDAERIAELEKCINSGCEKIDQFRNEGCLFTEWLYWAKRALRGERA